MQFFPQTTRFTCVRAERLISKTGLGMKGSSYLKKPLQPPHLEYPFSHQDGHLKDTPPFHPPICTLRRVPVHLLPHHDVGLLIFDLLDEHREHVHCNQRHQSAICCRVTVPILRMSMPSLRVTIQAPAVPKLQCFGSTYPNFRIRGRRK